MEYALELRGVTKRYDGFTLDRVGLRLPGGCIMGLIGENGAGKSTLIKLILGLIRKDGGEISVLGQSVESLPREVKEHLGVVLDESSFSDNFTLRDVNRIMGSIYRSWDGTRFLRYADRFSLPPKTPVKAYSHGTKMKLAIAAALSHDSRLLILDEATSGLDPVVRDEILDVFLEFIQDEDHAILVSSHILSDLEKLCDYITFIHKGRVVFSRAKDELLEEYGVLKGSPEELRALDPSAVVGSRINSFGAEALVLRNKLTGQHVVDKATIEDIMLYSIKEKERF